MSRAVPTPSSSELPIIRTARFGETALTSAPIPNSRGPRVKQRLRPPRSVSLLHGIIRTAMIRRKSVIAACTPSTVVSRSCVMSLIITFMFEPAKLQMNCASASGARKRRRAATSIGVAPAVMRAPCSARRAWGQRPARRPGAQGCAHDPVAGAYRPIGVLRAGPRPTPARRSRHRSALRARLLRCEADLAVRLEHGEADILERADLLQARLGLELLGRHPLPAQVALEDAPVDDQHDRLALQDGPQPPHAVAEPGGEDGEERDRRDDRRRAGQGVVALSDALLDEVAHDDEQDHVERLHRAELAPADRTRDPEDQEEDEDGAEDEVHGRLAWGTTRAGR